jgi:hypothetical protein
VQIDLSLSEAEFLRDALDYYWSVVGRNEYGDALSLEELAASPHAQRIKEG